MCDPVSIALTLGGAALSANQGQKQMKQQKQAAAQAQQNADRTFRAQEEATNRANAKQPNMAALASSNRTDNASSTSLTGPAGVDPQTLMLGRNTLLGQ